MKKTVLLLFVSLLIGLNACQNLDQASEQTKDSSTTTEAGTPSGNVITERLASLGLTTDSDWRGINLGDAYNTVAKREKSEPFERDDEHVGYTLELKNLETVDILYYQEDQKVSAIEVDLYVNTEAAVTEYRKDLMTYFSRRYGAGEIDEETTTWASSKGKIVTLKDVSKGKDYGLKIRILPSDDAVAMTK
ncbi:hypothetical protein [Spirosoma sp. KUDC1026]|uniref:hypothetical protein n=1 Tax=Spirosoma sp. KUDC1026 TaxID=2745947 RepID=UPI00159BA3EE|nr:hypothetical protein [Spirosoma sp. KUDC1026]QKZ13287.1 hypothetical protein HU175_11840 [Spirosoma sp. KUDC1026]